MKASGTGRRIRFYSIDSSARANLNFMAHPPSPSDDEFRRILNRFRPRKVRFFF
jgi:hypothetical protein